VEIQVEVFLVVILWYPTTTLHGVTTQKTSTWIQHIFVLLHVKWLMILKCFNCYILGLFNNAFNFMGYSCMLY